MRRRDVARPLGLALLAAALPAAGATAVAGPPSDTPLARARARFRAWLDTLERPAARGLLPYMAHAGGVHASALSPLASADVALWALSVGDVARADRIAAGLLHWQREVERLLPARVHGGLPSELPARGDGWVPGTAFYAGDNLLCMAALARTARVTGRGDHAEAALRIARWMRGTLFDGQRHGLWASNPGPPMHYMTADGAYDNAIHTTVEFLWLAALAEVDGLDPQGGWAAMEVRAADFLAAGQADNGAWHALWKPDTPGARRGRWQWYRGGDTVLGDDGLRASLATLRYGRTGQARDWLRWLQPLEGTYVPGYLDPRTGAAKFLPGDAPYVDLVCTGLLRSLHARLGDAQQAARCEAALLQWQAADGSWHWGRRRAGMQPLNEERAVITGVWAVGEAL